MLFYLTNAFLDITFATCWWILKTTGYLLYRGVYYVLPNKNNTNLNIEDSVIIIEKEELYDILLSQRKQIDLVSNNNHQVD